MMSNILSQISDFRENYLLDPILTALGLTFLVSTIFYWNQIFLIVGIYNILLAHIFGLYAQIDWYRTSIKKLLKQRDEIEFLTEHKPDDVDLVNQMIKSAQELRHIEKIETEDYFVYQAKMPVMNIEHQAIESVTFNINPN